MSVVNGLPKGGLLFLRLSTLELTFSCDLRLRELAFSCSLRLRELYILYPKDVMQKDGVWHLPLYMAMFL